MSNEHYLIISYFVMLLLGVALAGLAVKILHRAHRQATAASKKTGPLFRRLLPTWLVLAVLLGFMSVSYRDCAHQNYTEIVHDRQHLVAKNHEQAWATLGYLAAALLVYGFALTFFLWSGARQQDRKKLKRFPSAAPFRHRRA